MEFLGKSKLKANIFGQILTQAIQYIIPLIAMPLIANRIGAKEYGNLVMAIALANYAVVIVNFGLDYYSIARISTIIGSKEKISLEISAATTIKFILMLLISLPYILASYLIPQYTSKAMVLLGFLYVIAEVFSTLYIYQALQISNKLPLPSMISKSIYIILVYLLVQNSQDALTAIILLPIVNILTNIYLLSLLKKEVGLYLYLPKISDLKRVYNESKHLFQSNLIVSIYTASSTTILGFTTGPVQAGYFSAAERIVQGIKSLYGPILRAYLPHNSSLIFKNKKKAVNEILKLAWFCSPPLLILSIIIYFFSSEIIDIIYGPNWHQSSDAFWILAMTPPIIFISNLLGIHIMLNINMRKEFRGITAIGAAIGIIAGIYLSINFGIVGMSISTLLVELWVLSAMIVTVRNWIRK